MRSVILIKQTTKYLLDRNIKRLVRAALRTIVPGAYRCGRAYIYELEHLSDNVVFPESYEFRRTDDINAMVDFRLKKRICETRLKAGDLCFASYRGDKIVSIIWGHKGQYYVRGLGYLQSCSQDDSYVYGAITQPEERQKGLFKALLHLISKELLKSTSGKITALAETKNTISINTLRNVGYREVKLIEHRTLLWLKKTNILHLATKNVERRIFMFPPSGVYVI